MHSMHGGAQAALIGVVLVVVAIRDSSTIDGSPSTVTFQPRPFGQCGA